MKVVKKVLVIIGPTGVGKTALGIELADGFQGEIISGDAMQIYEKLDIGTAKATPEEQSQAVHHLINTRAFTESYSAADFQQEGREAITQVIEQEKLPIVVGGTGLYIQSLLYDFQLGEKEVSLKQRQYYEEYAQKYGNEHLWHILQKKDPLAARKIHANNRKKVVRALEVMETTGYSIMAPKKQPKALYDYYLIGLQTDRQLLYQRINQRVDEMLANGLLEEAALLYQHRQVQAAQGIGYKEFFPYFSGEESLETAVEKVKQNSRRYAKRQLTWFKNRTDANWYDLVQHPEQLPALKQHIADWLGEEI